MIKLRKATEADGAALAEIYRYYVENTAITFEYVPPTSEEFAQRIVHKSEKYPFIVAEDNGIPVGYAYASEYRERAAYCWDVETSVYLDKNHCGQGIGKRLYSALEEILKKQNVVNLYACITYPNSHSEEMHRSFGFELVGRFKAAGFKRGDWHGVSWFEKQISCIKQPLPIVPFPQLDGNTIEEILKNH